MISYKLPIKCTPQLAIVPPSYKIVDVTDPIKCGSLYLPHVHIMASQTTQPIHAQNEDNQSDSDWITVTIHCVQLTNDNLNSFSDYQSDPNNYENDYSRTDLIHRSSRNALGSLVQHCNAPVNTQESYMQLVGSFKHYYNKHTYSVFAETLNNPSQSFGVPTGSRTGETNYSRAVSEGSLTRTIT